MTKRGIYRHYKGPLYIVLGVVTNATNGEDYERMVLYHSVSHGIKDTHVRREAEFNELIGDPSGGSCLRFAPVEVEEGS